MYYAGESGGRLEERICDTNKTPSAHTGEIDDSITLFTESVEFCEALYAEIAGYRMTDVDANDLADEGEKHNVVCDEDKIEITLLVANVRVRGRGDAVRDEKKGSEWVWEALGDERGKDLPIYVEQERDQEELGRGSWLCMSSGGREHVKMQVPGFTTHLEDLRSDQKPGSG